MEAIKNINQHSNLACNYKQLSNFISYLSVEEDSRQQSCAQIIISQDLASQGENSLSETTYFQSNIQ